MLALLSHNLGKGEIMSGKRYTEEFKIAAVKQVVDRSHPAAEVAERLRAPNRTSEWQRVALAERNDAYA
jgi:transposase-like protein